MSIENKICDIIYNEMDSLLRKMVADFSRNYEKKGHNWLISEFSPTTLSYLVLVSSLESKYGNMFERIARQICILKYGEENVPTVIKGVGVSDDEYERYVRKSNRKQQHIISKIYNQKNDGAFRDFRAEYEGEGSGRNRVPSTLTQSELPKLLNKDLEKSDELIRQPVDLAFYDKFEGRWKLFEIKAGGDLDTSNAPQNVVKMLRVYASLGDDKANLYFATLYHKDGEGNYWDGDVQKYLGEDCLLIGKAFWEQILPDNISYEDLLKIYKKVFENIRVEDTLNKLIKDTVKNSSNREYQSELPM